MGLSRLSGKKGRVGECPVLSITGSDGTGGAGIQADVQTITALGGRALTVLTTLSIDDQQEGLLFYDLAAPLVIKQLQQLRLNQKLEAVKVGLVRNALTVKALRQELSDIKHLVCDPGILSARGVMLVEEDAVSALKSYLLPLVEVLTLRCDEAELLLGQSIDSDEDMLKAAQKLCHLGAEWVLLRGGRHIANRLTALLYNEQSHQFFSTCNIEGWQQHGVGGAMSSAIATRLAMGDDVPTAVQKAHEYMHNQVIYAPSAETQQLQPNKLYNRFLDLIAQHYTTAHDVDFYAQQLNISTRYLSEVTAKNGAQSPKKVIGNYVIDKAKVLLDSSRLTVQEISNQLGFATQAHFCKVFQQTAGVSPSQYRNRDFSQTIDPEH